MTSHAEARTPHAFPRTLLALVWVVAGLAVGVPGWLLLALSEESVGRLAGVGLTGAALLAVVAGVVVLRFGTRARRLSLAASTLLALTGITAVVALELNGRLFLRDGLLIGGVPVLAGLGTFLLAVRRPHEVSRR